MVFILDRAMQIIADFNHFLKNSVKISFVITQKQLETFGRVRRTVVTDALVPKRQAISSHNAD